jgi:hypothetical protein
MKLKKVICLIILSIPVVANLKAQIKEGYKAEIEVQAIGTTNGSVPFWMRANQFGSVPLNGVSGSLIARFSKQYENTSDKSSIHDKIFDWGFGLEGRFNGGQRTNFNLIEGYGRIKLGVFQIKAGRAKDVVGFNGDTSLSSGNFVVSGNALGIPKIDLSIPNYWTLPMLNNLLSIKGSFSHGWIGHSSVAPGNFKDNLGSIIDARTYMHQKSFYVRLGNENWKLKLYSGINHVAYWGDEKKVYGEKYTLSSIQTFAYTVFGKAYHAPGIPGSKIGNQLGSIDFGFDYDFDNFKVTGYRQFFYDIGGLYHLANLRDGLNGISVTNRNYLTATNSIKWRAILIELFYSANQGGEVWSKPTPSGPEDYYNNYYYRQGWSYQGVGLGNPLVTTRIAAKPGQAFQDYAFFINNRVIAVHSGFEGAIKDWNIKAKGTFSQNYGTFNTSKASKLTGDKDIYRTENIFKQVNQFSLMLETGRFLKKNMYYGASFAYDQGGLLSNSMGLLIRVQKTLD